METIYDNEETLPKIKNDIQELDPKLLNDEQPTFDDLLKNIKENVYTINKIDPYTMLGKINQILQYVKGLGIVAVGLTENMGLDFTLKNGQHLYTDSVQGAQGVSVVAVALTQEMGLDFTLSNGEHLYTASVQGAQGVGIVAVALTQEMGLDFTLSNGEHLYTASVQGPQGPKGNDGITPDLSNYVTTNTNQNITASKNFVEIGFGPYIKLLYDNTSHEFFIITNDSTKAINCPTKIDMHTANIVNVGTITGTTGDFTNINTSLANIVTAINNANNVCEKISGFSGYATGNHSLDSGKKFSNYNVIIFVFECTQSGANAYYYVPIPKNVFTYSTDRKHACVCSTANTSRYMNFGYTSDTQFKIINSSYVEMREIWGIK